MANTPKSGNPTPPPAATPEEKFLDGTECRTGAACDGDFKAQVGIANGPEPMNDVEEARLSTADETALDPFEVAATKALI